MSIGHQIRPPGDGLFAHMDDETQAYLGQLELMRRWKWHEYEQFNIEGGFVPNFVAWLSAFDSVEERQRWVHFLTERLMFVNRDELRTLVRYAANEILERVIEERVAETLQLPRFQRRRIRETEAYRYHLRSTAVLALSDSTQIDLFRRANSEISFDQFCSTFMPSHDQRMRMLGRLRDQVTSTSASFTTVVLVDDFYGSGTSLIGETTSPTVETKISRFIRYRNRLRAAGSDLFSEECKFVVLLYLASEQAEDHIRGNLDKLGAAWSLEVVQNVPALTGPDVDDLLADSARYWDPLMTDRYKGNAAKGRNDSRLPLVLYYNTPNNSLGRIWAQGVRSDGEAAPALFQRYEKYRFDRE